MISDQFLPPDKTFISINDVTPGQVYLTLNWNQRLFNCASAKYIIHTTGNCFASPNYTVSTNTTISYPNVTSTEQNCTLSLQTEVCGSLVGRKSDPLMVILKGIGYANGNKHNVMKVLYTPLLCSSTSTSYHFHILLHKGQVCASYLRIH